MTEPSRDYDKTAIPTGLPGPGIHVLDGLLTATEKQINLGRLHMRPIQWHLKTTGGYQNHWKRCSKSPGHKGRRNEVGPTLCPTMENLDLVYQETSDSKARHIPGRHNVVADRLSRLGQTIRTVVSPSRGLPLYAVGGTGPK